MDAAMNKLGFFWKRRIRNSIIAILLLVVFAAWITREKQQLGRPSFATGYVLLAAIVFLMLYNVRKKLPMIPLGKSSTWLQAHIYVGLGTIGVFLLHIGFRVPDGIFELILASLFGIVAASGIYGLYITRSIPKKLSQLSDEVIYENIPSRRHQLAATASQLALSSVSDTKATAIADFYTDRLIQFFERPRGVAFTMVPSGRYRRRLMKELSHIQQFCSKAEKQISDQMFSLIRKKDDLDYQHALQHKLKVWMFAHIAMSYSLLILALFHTVLAHAFYGGF